MVPRVLRLHPNTRERLERERSDAERHGVYRVAKRIHAVLLNGEGYTSGRIAEILRAPRSKVSDWLAKYETHGFEAMLEGHRSGWRHGLTGSGTRRSCGFSRRWRSSARLGRSASCGRHATRRSKRSISTSAIGRIRLWDLLGLPGKLKAWGLAA